MNSYTSPYKTALLFLYWLICLVSITIPIAAKNKNKQSALQLNEHLLLEEYEQAKQAYKEGRYLQAKSLFGKLRSKQEVPSLSPYIHFYYALSAYYNGEKELATQVFFWIYVNFPLWNKQNEIRYWCAQCKFQEGHFSEALTLLSPIKDKGMAQSVLQMKKYFLKQIEDCTLLQKLVEEFPDDFIIKEALYHKAALQAYITQDFALLDELNQRYNLSNDPYDPLRHLQSKRKNIYHVAVLLPFFVEELNYEACEDQFIIELYQGIQLAVETLAKEGVAINLFAFDTKNDTAVTEALLAQKELKFMDLIVGPLYPSTIPLVAAFAQKHQINFVNPISVNPAIINSNPFAFLFQPSLETHAQKAAQLTLSDIHLKPIDEPCIAVFYGAGPKDVLQATLYKRIVEQSLGREIDLFVQLSNNTMIKQFFHTHDKLEQEAEVMQEENAETTQAEVMQKENAEGTQAEVMQEENAEGTQKETDKLDLTKVTHIYIPSQQALLTSNVVNHFYKLGTKPLIIGHEQWIKQEILTVNQLNKLPFLFLAPNYIDFDRPALVSFREQFFKQTATQPTEYSYIGYEMMLFFGRMLATYGIYFQKEWENKRYDGTIFQMINYGKYHSNQHIPVLQFKKNKFAVVAHP